MDRCPPEHMIRAALAGTLDVEGQERLEQHLEHCPACRHSLTAITDEDSVIPASRFRSSDSQGSAALQEVMERLSRGGDMPAASINEIGKSENVERQSVFSSPPQLPGFPQLPGQYEIRRLIGRGGMGLVYEARDTVLNRTVAIKVLSPLSGFHGEWRSRFLREAQAAAALSHEHIVGIFGVHLDGDLPFLVLQYIDGESLADRLGRLGRLPLQEVVRIGAEVARGLAAAHAKGLIHRDIKPANILLERETDRARIADFGLARNVNDATLTMEGFLAGTPDFMSPEQALGREVDARSDLFSLGVVLYLAATGVLPFADADPCLVLDRVRRADFRPLDKVDPSLPAWFCEIVTRLLSKDPRDRIESAAASAELLEQSAKPAPIPGRARRRRAAILTSAALIFAAGALAIRNWPDRAGNDPAVRNFPLGTGFVIEGRQAGFARLEDALAAARDGDVIEVHGNGPFPVPPLRTGGKRLAIRAAREASPVFVSEVPNRVSPAPMLTADADLFLEGITIYWTGEAPAPARTETSMLASAALASTGGEFRLVHCRVVAADRSGCVGATCAKLSLSQCQLQCEQGAAIFWRPTGDGNLNIHGCVLEGNTGLTLLTALDAKAQSPAAVTLTNNTFAVEKSFQFVVQFGPRQKFHLTAIHNIFDNSQIANLYATRIPRGLLPDTPEKAIGHLRSVAHWNDEGNVYRRGQFFGVNSMLVPRTVQRTEFASLAEWLGIWDLPASASIEGDIRFSEREHKQIRPPRLERIENPSGPVPRRVGADPDRVGPLAPGRN